MKALANLFLNQEKNSAQEVKNYLSKKIIVNSENH